MKHGRTITMEVPRNWQMLKLPAPLNERLQELLDRQDEQGRLSAKDRREAEALGELAEMLSLFKLRARGMSRKPRP